MHTVYENVKLAEMAIELKEQHVNAAPALGSPDMNRPECADFNRMIAEIQHISGPTWSEHDVMSLIKTQNDFVNNPLACPITRAKWGTKSNQAILKNLERIRTSENMYLQRYFRVNPETWSPTDMNELNQACQTATFQDVHIPGKSQAAIRCRVEELLSKEQQQRELVGKCNHMDIDIQPQSDEDSQRQNDVLSAMLKRLTRPRNWGKTEMTQLIKIYELSEGARKNMDDAYTKIELITGTKKESCSRIFDLLTQTG